MKRYQVVTFRVFLAGVPLWSLSFPSVLEVCSYLPAHVVRRGHTCACNRERNCRNSGLATVTVAPLRCPFFAIRFIRHPAPLHDAGLNPYLACTGW